MLFDTEIYDRFMLHKIKGILIQEDKMTPKDWDRDVWMERWDLWRKYIAEGGGGSWPRDAFESLLDYFEESWESGSDASDLKQHARNEL
jgi:hypothetical protein